MKISKRSLLLVPVTVLALSFFSINVYAQETETGTGSPSEPNPITETDKRDQAPGQTKPERVQPKKEVESQNSESKKDAKQLKLAEKCEKRKQGLEQKIENINKNAKKHLDHFSAVHEKALAFQIDKALAPEGFTSLATSAESAKTQAEDSVAKLADLTPSIDCQKGTAASDVAEFKEAASQAREDLHTYKKSIKDLLKSLENAKDNDVTKNANTESGEQQSE